MLHQLSPLWRERYNRPRAALRSTTGLAAAFVSRTREAFMANMRVVQVSRPQGPLEIAEREIPQPRAGSVRVKVQACGICHSDSFVKDGTFPGIEYPRVPGHEVVGVV